MTTLAPTVGTGPASVATLLSAVGWWVTALPIDRGTRAREVVR